MINAKFKNLTVRKMLHDGNVIGNLVINSFK